MKYKNYCVIFVSLLTLTACNSPPNEWTVKGVDLKDVNGLEDCTYYLIDRKFDKIRVIRCPNSDVTVNQQYGKTRRSVIVEEY